MAHSKKQPYHNSLLAHHLQMQASLHTLRENKKAKRGLTENRTRITGFKDRYDNHYTMKPSDI
jgi:hypothetical protein